MNIRRFVTALLFVLTAGAGTIAANAGLLQTLEGTVQGVTQPVNVIVRLGPSGNITSVLGLLNGLLLDQIPGTRTYLVSVPSLPAVLPIGVASLERDFSIGLPPDGRNVQITPVGGTAALWYDHQPALLRVEAPAAHRYSTGRGVVVADIDASFDDSHPALRGRLANGHDFVADAGAGTSSSGGLEQSNASYMFQSSASYMFQSSASYMFQSSVSYMFQGSGIYSPVATSQPDDAGTTHGTFTAGLIAAVAPGATIMPIRAFDNSGNADIFTLAKSIRYAVENGANVINMSWGTDTDSDALRQAIDFALGKGIVLVAAAGNANSAAPFYPAAYRGVMAVAATDDMDRKAGFSSYGRFIAVSAPGVNVISAWPGGRYGIKSGTSFSAPIVAAEAALLDATGCTAVAAAIEETASPIDDENPGYAGELGRGRVDLLKSVNNRFCEGDE